MLRGFFVRMKGFEPSHQRRCHLKAVRLPISPHPRHTIYRLAYKENKTLLLILGSIKLKLNPNSMFIRYFGESLDYQLLP